MDNKQDLANNDLAQQSFEKENKSFFQQVIDCLKNTENLLDILKRVDDDLNDAKFDEEALKYVGMISFVIGNDYGMQRYLQKTVLTNVQKRIEEVNLSNEVLEVYKSIIHKLSILDYNEIIETIGVKYRDLISSTIPNTPQTKILFAQIKSFLGCIDIPMSLANGVADLKKEPLTYQKILQFNNVITEQASWAGVDINKYVKLYGNELFRNLLSQAAEYFSQGKFTFIYTDIIKLIVWSSKQFKLTFSPEGLTDEDFERFKKEYEATLKTPAKQEETEETCQKFTAEAAKDLMENHPNQFILEVLKDLGVKDLKDENQYPVAIENLLDDLDYLQNIYTYLCKNQNSTYRGLSDGETLEINDDDCKRIVNVLFDKIKEYGTEYKELVEINCSTIPGEQLNRIVSYVNETIECCLMETDEQKQYLVSQAIENGIVTWQHLQQIIDVIETCKISGADVEVYQNLHRYCNENTHIADVYKNSEKIEKIQNKISILTAFQKWFKWFIESDKDSEN